MRKKETKIRYILMLDSTTIGESPTMSGIGELVGCTKQYIHKQLKNSTNTFKLKKKVYTIIDRLA